MDPSEVPSEWQGDISGQATAAAIVCLIVSVFILIARGLAKPLTKTRAGWDDWLLIPAGLFTVGLCGLTLYDTNRNDGLGQHELAVVLEDPDKLVTFAKSQLLWTAFYTCCCLFPKLVLLTLYLRLFTSRRMRMVSYVLMGITGFYAVLAIIITQLMCIPISALWTPSDTAAKCINLPAWFAYSTIPNVIIDACVIALPIPALKGLNLPLRDRIGLILTFSAGGIGTGAGIARTVVYRYINGATDDVTWSGVPLAIVGVVECTLYLMAAALPGLRPLYLFARRRGQFSQPKQSSYGLSDGQELVMSPTTHTDMSNSTSNHPRQIMVAQSYSVRGAKDGPVAHAMCTCARSHDDAV